MELGFFILACIYVTCNVIWASLMLIRHRENRENTRSSTRGWNASSKKAEQVDEIDSSISMEKKKRHYESRIELELRAMEKDL